MLEALKAKTYNLLRWSEKYTKTDMVYLTKGGGWMSLGRVVSMTCAFLLSVAFANLLPKEVYGNYKYVISAISLLSLFTLSGMGTAMARSSAQGKDGSLDLAIKTEIKWGLLGGLLSALLAVYYWWNGNMILSWSFGIVSIFVPFFNVYNLYSAILQGKKRFDLLVKFEIYTQITNFILVLPVILLTQQVWILIIPYLFVNSWLQRLWLHFTKKKVNLNKEQDPEVVKYGKHLSALNILNMGAALIDQILVFHFLGAVNMAIYNIALAPTEQLKGLFKMIGPLAFPKFAEQKQDIPAVAIYKKMFKFGLLVLSASLIYIFAAPYLYSILFPAYQESVLYTQILAISLIAIINILPITALQAQMKTKKLYWWNSIVAIVQILSVFVGVVYFGLLGAVLAKVFVRFFETAFIIFFINNSKKYVPDRP